MEIEHLKSRNDALIKENQEKKEKADYSKLFCSEEKLRHGRELVEIEELLTVSTENALFAQRSTTSASQEARLARISQVFQVIFDINFSISLNL